MKLILTLLRLSVILIFFISCKDDSSLDSGIYVKDTLNVNKELSRLMRYSYYWYDQVPNVNPSFYSTPIELMEVLRVNPPDRWSYVTTRTELEAFYNQGAYVGFGFGSGFTVDNKLFITFTFKNSPLRNYGIDRGWQIISIDGQTPTLNNYYTLIGPNEPGVSKAFVFKSPSGVTQTCNFIKEELSLNSVLVDSVYSLDGRKVGYFALENFVESTKTELNALFSEFKTKGVKDLIVDLRYNGGGQLDVSSYLANLIGGNIPSGKIFAELSHNGYNVIQNSSFLFSAESNSLFINRVIFITTNGSASASEILINGLKPFMEVILVGERTQGKPVGMYVFTFKDPTIDWAFVPVCFIVRNANSEGEYFDGIPVDISAADDIMSPLGDINEASLNSALVYLGGISLNSQKKNLPPFNSIVGKGLSSEIGAW